MLKKSGTKSERKANDFSLRSNSSILRHCQGPLTLIPFLSLSLSHIANKNFIAQLSCCCKLKKCIHAAHFLFKFQADHHEIKRELKEEKKEIRKKRLRSKHKLKEEGKNPIGIK